MIALRNLALQRGTRCLLTDATVSIHAGWKVGLTGANGTGKSSLLALLRGELMPEHGDASLPADWRISHVAQEVPEGEQPALEYVLDGDRELRAVEAALAQAQAAGDGLAEAEAHAHYDTLDGYTARARAARLLDGLGFSVQIQENPVGSFSGGWRMRLNLAQALMSRAELMLLDEPTNHLDLDALLWFEQWLKQYRGTLLLISHDRDFLDNVVDHVLHLENTELTLYSGHYSDFERQRAAALANQQAMYEKQQRTVAHLHAFIDRFRAKASKARQAQSRLKALANMEEIAAAHVDSPFRFAFKEPIAAPTPLLVLDEGSIGYVGVPIVRQLDLRIEPGSRLGLLGPNGAGKSTLLKLLAGQLPLLSGELTVSNGVKIGYFAQHQLEQLHLEDSPLQHIQRLDPKIAEQTLRDFLGGFGFGGERAEAQVRYFSGGEKARLALALLIWQRPNLLLLDEPTNHLDLEMRQALALALQDYNGAMVLVSHDRHLLRSTTDELCLVAEGRLQVFEGDLDDYRDWLFAHRTAQAQALNPAPVDSKTRQQQKQQNAEQRGQRRQLENRVKKIEQQLAQLEDSQAVLEQQLADPALYADRAKAQACASQQTALKAQLAQLEEDWLAAHEALDALG